MTYGLQVERLVDATPEEVFDALTDPDGLREWFKVEPGWEVAVVAADARVGGMTSVEFGDPAVGWRCREDMTYTALDRPTRVVYNQTFTASMGDETNAYDTVVTMTLEEQDGKTLVTIVETGYPDENERDQHQNGWPSFLARVEEVALSRRVA